MEELCGRRGFRHKLGGCTCCCWRCPDPAAAASKLKRVLQVQMLQQLPGCVCKSSSSLPPLSFHGIRAWYRLRVEQQAQEAKEGQQEVIISSPFVFATASVSGALREAPANDIESRSCLELFGKHQQTTSDRGAVWSSSGSTSKRHRIEELSGALREAPANDIESRSCLRQDEAIGTVRNFGAETAFLHHLDLCF